MNESAVWMNRLNLNDSLINSHSLPPTGGFNFIIFMSKYFNYQYSMFYVQNKTLGLFMHLKLQFKCFHVPSEIYKLCKYI